ncbi:MAG: hypothetical protein JRI84_13255 [Deltaproteobacteria bacterium]|nr:hypothetical protein [Deltaproteobacteria bacterium]MBW1936497.1 hypothetical protein [Deltaproteobacteria bacterium]
MAAKIMIERKFKQEPLPENFQVINEIRRKAMGRKGYIGGETLVGYEDKGAVGWYQRGQVSRTGRRG